MHAAVMTTRLVPAAAAEVHAQWCMPPAKRKCTAITRSSAEWGSFHSRRQVQSLIASAAQAEFPGEAAVAATPDAAHAEEDPHEGYQLFKLEGCNFVVRKTPEGLLDLADSFVLEGDGDQRRPAAAAGAVPAGPALYFAAEWASSFGGNVFERQPPEQWVIKLYLVPVTCQDPFQLDLSVAYCLDGPAQSLHRCDVLWLAPQDTPPAELRLRIREAGLTVDTARSLPHPELVTKASMAGVPAVSELERERAHAQGVAPEQLLGSAGAGGRGGLTEAEEEGGAGQLPDVLYDDDSLRDFLVEVDDDNEEYEFDMPASDY